MLVLMWMEEDEPHLLLFSISLKPSYLSLVLWFTPIYRAFFMISAELEANI